MRGSATTREFARAFAISGDRIGRDLHEAIGQVSVAPFGYPLHLGSQKVAHLNIEAQCWGETAISLDVHLRVHDPSGAAGVNIDLVRVAAALLKSPPGTAI